SPCGLSVVWSAILSRRVTTLQKLIRETDGCQKNDSRHHGSTAAAGGRACFAKHTSCAACRARPIWLVYAGANPHHVCRQFGTTSWRCPDLLVAAICGRRKRRSSSANTISIVKSGHRPK